MAKKSTVEVCTIKLKISDVTLEVSMEEAKDLFQALTKMFGNKPSYTTYVPYNPYPYGRWDASPVWYTTSGTVDLVKSNSTVAGAITNTTLTNG